MQLLEPSTTHASQHLLVDEIYAPSLSNAASKRHDAQAAHDAQHQKAINELHRFLESSCDCV